MSIDDRDRVKLGCAFVQLDRALEANGARLTVRLHDGGFSRQLRGWSEEEVDLEVGDLAAAFGLADDWLGDLELRTPDAGILVHDHIVVESQPRWEKIRHHLDQVADLIWDAMHSHSDSGESDWIWVFCRLETLMKLSVDLVSNQAAEAWEAQTDDEQVAEDINFMYSQHDAWDEESRLRSREQRVEEILRSRRTEGHPPLSQAALLDQLEGDELTNIAMLNGLVHDGDSPVRRERHQSELRYHLGEGLERTASTDRLWWKPK